MTTPQPTSQDYAAADPCEAALCPQCEQPGLRLASVHVARGKWRAVYRCPACRVDYFTFKREKRLYDPGEFTHD